MYKIRPSGCNWYFCDSLYDYMEKKAGYEEFDKALGNVAELWMQMMAQRGFGVFSLDNRGSNAAPRGHAWEAPIYQHLGDVELGGPQQADRQQSPTRQQLNFFPVDYAQPTF